MKLRPSERRAQKQGERERALGIDPNDDAARWLTEHDPEPKPETPKAARKSKTLHRWRQRGEQRGPAAQRGSARPS